MSTITRKTERGSIPITMMVMLVVTTLVIAILATAQSGLKLARRGGDSANALQTIPSPWV